MINRNSVKKPLLGSLVLRSDSSGATERQRTQLTYQSGTQAYLWRTGRGKPAFKR